MGEMPSKEKVQPLIDKFKSLQSPDHHLTRQLLSALGLYSIVELEFTMNSFDPAERLAAMKMVERYLDDLVSGDVDRWKKAKKELMEIYYQVESSDEEALL